MCNKKFFGYYKKNKSTYTELQNKYEGSCKHQRLHFYIEKYKLLPTHLINMKQNYNIVHYVIFFCTKDKESICCKIYFMQKLKGIEKMNH